VAGGAGAGGVGAGGLGAGGLGAGGLGAGGLGAAPGVADAVVLAAGGAVWRRAQDGGVEVVLIHRPRYDDWSLPKGKVDPGETDVQAALREVREEASIDARIGSELPTTTYVDRSGKQKRVRYWAMTVAGGNLAGANEVDEAIWLPLGEARARLSYPRDTVVLDALARETGG
jgi:8-oxo-dGTP pyrophosphatase MutT (NUDIX family)